MSYYGENIELTKVTTSLTPEVFTSSGFVPAQADDAATVADVVTLSTGERLTSGKVKWVAHGLTIGTRYFLSSATAGAYTDTPPTEFPAQALFMPVDEDTVLIDVRPIESAASWSRQVLVDPVSGLDLGNGSTTPVKTLAFAHEVAGNGESILLAEGDYAAQPALTITKSNITLAGAVQTGAGGVKTTVGALTATGIGPKFAALTAASLALQHPAGNGAHTANMQVTGETTADSPSFWEDHRSKFVGNVTLSGSGARYFYGSQFEGSVTAALGSGFVSFSDITGANGVITIPAGVPYTLRNVSGFILNIDPAAIDVVSFVKLLGGTEALAQRLAQAHFAGLATEALHLAGRLTVAEAAVVNQTTDAEIAAETWERSAALVFDQTTSGRTITLAQAMDGTVTHLRVFRNTGTVQMHIETHKLKPDEAAIGILPAGETDWIFVGGGGEGATSSADGVDEVVNNTGAMVYPGEIVYLIPDSVAGGPWFANYLTSITEEHASQSPIVAFVAGDPSSGAGTANLARLSVVRFNSGAIVKGINASFSAGEAVWYRPHETARWGTDHGDKGNAVRLGYAYNSGGDASGTSIRFNPEWAASVVYKSDALPAVSGAVLSRSYAGPALIVTVGRYIVPDSGTSGVFVGEEGKYADWAGAYDTTDPDSPFPTDFVFVDPADGDRVLVNDTGEVWEFELAGSPQWTKVAQSTGLPIYAYDEDEAYGAQELVIRGGALYQANDNIPANATFAIGLSGQTWEPIGGAAEKGELGLAADVNLELAASPSKLFTLTLPSAGEWRVAYSCSVYAAGGGSDDAGYVELRTSNGLAVPNSRRYMYVTNMANAGFVLAAEVIITVTEPSTFNLVGWRTANIYNQNVVRVGGSNTSGNSSIVWQKIAGFLPLTIPGINDQVASKYFDIGDMRYQWGTSTLNTTQVRTIWLPAPFADTEYSVVASVFFGDSAQRGVNVYTKAQSNFTARSILNGSGSGVPFDWIAIGRKP